MFVCFLMLLRTNAASPAPFLAIPVVVAGLAMSVAMIVSGVMGLIASPRRAIIRGRRVKPLVTLTSSPRFLSLSPFRR